VKCKVGRIELGLGRKEVNRMNMRIRSLITYLFVGISGAVLGLTLVALSPRSAQAQQTRCEPSYEWCGFECVDGRNCCYLCTYP
jgi:hypothetical protein